MDRPEARSFALDVRRLDDGPPLFDLGLVVCAERLRRLLLARENLQPEIGEPGAGFTAAERTGRGQNKVVAKFDPAAEETLFIPRLKGG